MGKRFCLRLAFACLTFHIFSGPGLVPKPSPGLEVQFPVKNAGFGCVCVELCHFSSFLKVLESCEAIFAYLGTPFYDFQTWEGFFEAKLSSRDQVGC